MNLGRQSAVWVFKGQSVRIGGQEVHGLAAVELRADMAVELVNGSAIGEFLMLQGKPIGEPVVQYGPFVMNTQAEIAQTLADYQRTQFGSWSFDSDTPVHGRDPARFDRCASRPRTSAPRCSASPAQRRGQVVADRRTDSAHPA